MDLPLETDFLQETTLTMKEKFNLDSAVCSAHHRAISDTMDILSGKWKIRIIGSLSFGKQRFMELKANIDGVAAKMLSKELQQLELNGLVTRTVLATKPITVEYNLTEYGHSLQPIIKEMSAWGLQHRKRVLKGMTTK